MAPNFNLNDPAQLAEALEYQKKIDWIKDESKLANARERRGPTTIPDGITLRDLLAEPDLPVPFRIAGCQPKESRVICAAQFKAGKTTLVANVVRSLLDGDPFLGKYPVEPVEGAIALLDFEMSKSQLRSWYRSHQIKNDGRIIVYAMRGLAASFDPRDPEVRAMWASRFRALGVTYVIVDCLRPILDALGLDEHREVGAFLVPLDALLAEGRVPEAVVVHHMGHTNERSRGDSRLRDWPDVEWRLMRKDDDPASARFFTAYGRDVDVAEQELGYDATTRRLTIVGGSRREVGVEEALPAVLTFIRSSKTEPGRNEILRGLKESGHSQNALKAAIKLGIDRGAIATKPGERGAQLHSVVTEAKGEQPAAPSAHVEVAM